MAVATGRAFLLTPLREGRQRHFDLLNIVDLISTHAPAGGATSAFEFHANLHRAISTHAPAGGATAFFLVSVTRLFVFLLTPLREGRRKPRSIPRRHGGFLLTPLREGRLQDHRRIPETGQFLLTPLREGRRLRRYSFVRVGFISTHAPAGGATRVRLQGLPRSVYFYSRPCGRGDAFASAFFAAA